MTQELWHRLLSAELSPAKSRGLIEVLGSRSISNLPELLALPGLDSFDRARISQFDQTEYAAFLAEGGKILGLKDLPPTIAEVDFPPLGLYTLGDTSCLEAPTVAIVGTRRAGGYGRAVAAKFAEEFARAGVTVLSGGAYGIDASAHQGALKGGRTAAVLFTAVTDVYPRQHGGLFRQIRESGCLVSQFPLSVRGNREYRPLARNRIIAALSQAIVIVEAPVNSGSLSTASEAAELDRPVFVVPGMIDNLNFQGSHQLIREGATLVDHPHQVLHHLGVKPVKKADTVVADGIQTTILAALTVEPISSEVLSAKTGLDHSEVLNELTSMELDGTVVRMQGKYAKTL